MSITVRRLPKKPTANRTLTSRIIEWLSSTVLGIAIAITGAAIGLFDHPAIVAIAISVGSVVGQCVSVIAVPRHKMKTGITR